MHRPNLLTFLSPGVRRAVPAAAGLALLVAVAPAGRASAASGGCTTSGNQVTCAFTFPPGPQTWTVPAGVSQATFTLYGAEGGKASTGEAGGLGAAVTATLPVTAGTVLQLNPGQAGGTSSGTTFGGGGAAGDRAGGGGGATDVRAPAADGTYPLANRLLVAGGGGGRGAAGGMDNTFDLPGGSGGNADSPGGTGSSADDSGATLGGGGGGGAGTTAGPGLGGVGGTVSGTSTSSCSFTEPSGPGGDGGTVFIGGFPSPASQDTGGAGGPGAFPGTGGGGGGGGYYGAAGGGGGVVDQGCVIYAGGGGGGGGASYTGGVSGAVITDGVAAPDNAPDGEVIITYTPTVGQAATTTALSSSADPSVAGQPVTFTATVSADPPGGGTPTGAVTFSDGGSPIGTATLDGSGTATITASSLAAGAHTITASYGGDNNFSGSAGSLTQTVNRLATTTALSSSANPSVIGGRVSVTATVSAKPPGGGTPTGRVTFSSDGRLIGTATLNGSGTATITAPPLAIGAHTITASYGGDRNFTGSTGSLTQRVAYAVKLLYNTTKAYPSGTTLAIKLQLLNAASANVSTTGITVTVTGLSPSPAPRGRPPSGTFTFLTTGPAAPGYEKDVRTAGYPAGTYTLSFTAGSDPTTHTAPFVIR